MNTQTEPVAGRALDALIQLRVFRQRPTEVYRPAAAGGGVYGQVPEYSTRIDRAWLIVEEMGRRGFHCRINTPFKPGSPHFAGFTPHDFTGWNGRPDHEGSGGSASEAICRAALVAVEKAAEAE